MSTPQIVNREEWLAVREQLLVREKEHTHLADELAQARRDLPWLPVDKNYTLQTADGPGRWRSCSTAAPSWSSTTSCSVPI